jgi:hypothetical protein
VAGPGNRSFVNRARYQGSSDLRDALTVHAIDESMLAVLADLAEGLLLARDAAEAIWKGMRACAPPLPWPPSWDRRTVSPQRAVRRH